MQVRGLSHAWMHGSEEVAIKDGHWCVRGTVVHGGVYC
jgi:hypothetical protein